MANASTEFLEQIGRRGRLPVLEQIRGRLRLDLIEGPQTESWLIVVDDGNVQISRDGDEADCVIQADRVYFDRIAAGEANALAALLRGLIQIEGNLQLALAVGRALPGPPHSRWRGHRRRQAFGGQRG